MKHAAGVRSDYGSRCACVGGLECIKGGRHSPLSCYNRVAGGLHQISGVCSGKRRGGRRIPTADEKDEKLGAEVQPTANKRFCDDTAEGLTHRICDLNERVCILATHKKNERLDAEVQCANKRFCHDTVEGLTHIDLVIGRLRILEMDEKDEHLDVLFQFTANRKARLPNHKQC